MADDSKIGPDGSGGSPQPQKAAAASATAPTSENMKMELFNRVHSRACFRGEGC